MATPIQLGKSYTVTVTLNGGGKNPQWHSTNAGIATVNPGETSPATVFSASVTPVSLGTCSIEFACVDLNGNINLTDSIEVEVVEGPADAIVSITIAEN